MTYPINEIFAGIEGEGHSVGTPCIRVRFQGCSVTTCKLRKLCDQPEAIPAEGGTAARR
jgi:organic radical activating enzyme